MSQSLTPLIQSFQTLLEKVEAMEPGGDLESLIDESLGEIDREATELCLKARGQSASSPSEAFPPSGLPGVPKPLACLAASAPSGVDVAGGSGL